MSQMQVGGRGSPIKPKCPNVKMSQMAQGGEGSENFGTMSQSLLFFILKASLNHTILVDNRCEQTCNTVLAFICTATHSAVQSNKGLMIFCNRQTHKPKKLPSLEIGNKNQKIIFNRKSVDFDDNTCQWSDYALIIYSSHLTFCFVPGTFISGCITMQRSVLLVDKH